ncbi:MAG: GTPase Era [Rhodothermales bacterium]|nr:GTPase Era [Rhodothermales bacterium]
MLYVETPDKQFKSGYVAIVGKPNVGKSTLINALVGRKLSIVTRRPQTTRHRVLAILTSEDYQVILLDTPGVIKPRYRLHESMMQNVDSAVADADLVLFMAEASSTEPDSLSLERLRGTRSILAINKIDLVRREDALPLAEKYMGLDIFETVVPISAKSGYQVDVLLEEIVSRLAPGPQFYPSDVLSEHPERFFIAELVREQVFKQLREELPYSTQVNVINLEPRPDGKDLIDAEIVVDRDSQKGIVIGKGGQQLKKIGSRARVQIEEFLGREVFLRLHVKVRQGWRDSPGHLKSFGF